jgi:Zn-dependent membrane protease YugP
MTLGFVFADFWWLAIPGVLLGLYAQMRVTSTYGRYLRVGTASGLTGAEAAREILDRAGLHEMPIQEVGGHLTDHYDPTKKALFLSSENYRGSSISAVGVAAHEAGHALQHQAAYAPLQWRMTLVPVTQFASGAAQVIFLLGMMMNIAKLAVLGVIVFAVIALFQLITLPVEFDASNRAKAQLSQLGLIRGEEGEGVKKVLNAAALTYVAALVTALLYLLQFVLIMRGGNRN